LRCVLFDRYCVCVLRYVVSKAATMIEWTDEALDAAAVAINGRGYSRFLSRNKATIRNEMRALLNAAIAAQGVIEAPPLVTKLFDMNEKNKSAFKSIDMTMLLAWEDGYATALIDCTEIAKETHDDYDKNDPYCQGMCDAATGITMRIEKLKKDV